MIGAVLALALAGQAPPATETADRLLEISRPVMRAVGELAYFVGACEPHINRRDVDYYVREFMAPEPANGRLDPMVEAQAGVFARLYGAGRDDRGALDLGLAQCERLLAEHYGAARQAAERYRADLDDLARDLR